MVHNGIEYADMQLISEVYDVMKVRIDLLHCNESMLFLCHVPSTYMFVFDSYCYLKEYGWYRQ